MADRILISTEDYRRISRNLQTLSDELSDCAAALGRVMLTNDAGGELRINLRGALRSVSGSMPDGQLRNVVPGIRTLVKRLSSYSDQLARATNRASDMFESTESELASMQMSESQEAVFSGGGAGAGSGTSNHAGFDRLGDGLELFRNLGKYTPQQITEYGITAIFDAAGLISIAIGGLNAVSDGNTTALGWETEFGWKLGGKAEFFKQEREKIARKTNGENPMRERLPLFEVSVERKTSKSIFNISGEVNDDRQDAKGSFDVLKGSVSGKLHGGMGYVSDNGDFKLSPGIGGSFGLSASIFEGTVSSNYELIDNVTITSKATASAGTVNMEGDFTIGFVGDEFGLHADVGAEALAGEIKGDVGVDLGGIKGSVGASLNYGIGAKAEFGFKEGKFVYDVGATLGVGGSVYGEVDLSGLAENVYEGAKYVYEGAKEIGSNIYEGAVEIGSSLYEGAKNCGEAISGFCSSVVDFLTWG